MRRLTALLCALALCLGLSGCAEEEPEPTPTPTPAPTATPQPYVEPTGLSLGYSSAGSLHPMEAADQGSLDVDSLVYDGLFRLDESFRPQPMLAESAVKSNGGLTWTIAVKGGVFFSDGTTMTAEHVAASLRAARRSPRYAGRLSAVTEVRAEDDETVVVTLSRPNGDFPALLDVPVFLEREEGLPLGTGPYAFVPGEDAPSLRYNPAWWQGKEPAFTDVSLVAFDTLEDRAAAFGSGAVTVVTTDFNAAAAPSWSGTYETHDYTTSVMMYVGFNTAEERPCADPRVRLALSRAFDRNSIVNVLMAGHGEAAALPMQPGHPLYDGDTAAALVRDDAAAAALLEEAGWIRGDDGRLAQRKKALSLTLAVNRDSAVKQSVAAALAQSLESLGIDVTVQSMDWDSYVAALARGNFDLYLGEVRLQGDFDWSALVCGGALDYGKYQNEAMNAALNSYRASSDTARSTAARTMWRLYAQEMPFAVLCFKTNSLLARWGMAGSYAPTQDHPFNGIENWTTTGE